MDERRRNGRIVLRETDQETEEERPEDEVHEHEDGRAADRVREVDSCERERPPERVVQAPEPAAVGVSLDHRRRDSEPGRAQPHGCEEKQEQVVRDHGEGKDRHDGEHREDGEAHDHLRPRFSEAIAADDPDGRSVRKRERGHEDRRPSRLGDDGREEEGESGHGPETCHRTDALTVDLRRGGEELPDRVRLLETRHLRHRIAAVASPEEAKHAAACYPCRMTSRFLAAALAAALGAALAGGNARGSVAGSAQTSGAPAWNARIETIDAALRARMTGSSWRPGCPVGFTRLRLVTVRHWGMDGRVHRGRLVVHRDEAGALVRVMRRLFEIRFPLRRMWLVDAFHGSDARSMRWNNTSAFNCRFVSGTRRWSQHAYGRAIDVNPIQNPYVSGAHVSPAAGRPYADRAPRVPGMILPRSRVVSAFAAVGWRWGGYWSSAKDYQHFSRTGT